MLKKLFCIGLLSVLFSLPSVGQMPYNTQPYNSQNQNWMSVGVRGANSLGQSVSVRLGKNSSAVLAARTPLHALGIFRVRPGQPVSITSNSGLNNFRVMCGTIPSSARKITITAYRQGSIYRCGMQVN